MRRRLALLTVTAWLVLTAAVVTAAPAGARNVGGTMPTGALCLSPGNSGARANDVLSCFCYIAPPLGERNVGGTVPAGTTTCPPGILRQQQRPDRNVGG
jgi:hypothetical protein